MIFPSEIKELTALVPSLRHN